MHIEDTEEGIYSKREFHIKDSLFAQLHVIFFLCPCQLKQLLLFC